MLTTLLQMFALIGMGLAWSVYNPARMDSRTIRKVLTDAVYYIFLPALVFKVLWQADLGLQSVKIAGGPGPAIGEDRSDCRHRCIQRPVDQLAGLPPVS